MIGLGVNFGHGGFFSKCIHDTIPNLKGRNDFFDARGRAQGAPPFPQAIQNGQQGTFVYVIKADDTVEARVVTTSETQLPGQLIVQKGLAAGERIVTDGQLRLVPGSKVQIKSAAADSITPPAQSSTGS